MIDREKCIVDETIDIGKAHNLRLQARSNRSEVDCRSDWGEGWSSCFMLNSQCANELSVASV